jgi:pimeloyl-ACP methyl ester carboxylesterase
MGYEYLDDLASELSARYRVVTFQQRGLDPSTTTGPYTVAQALADVVAVLDHLGWDRAVVAGHSWGGTLALRLAAAHPERLLGVLGTDTIGVVGDGGMAAFSTELRARTSKRAAARLAELEQREQDGDAAATIEALRILGPLYFADPTRPPIPDPRFRSRRTRGSQRIARSVLSRRPSVSQTEMCGADYWPTPAAPFLGARPRGPQLTFNPWHS